MTLAVTYDALCHSKTTLRGVDGRPGSHWAGLGSTRQVVQISETVQNRR